VQRVKWIRLAFMLNTPINPYRNETSQRGRPLRQPSFAKARVRDRMAAGANKPVKILLYDRYLVFAMLAVMLMGLMMVYSASIVISEKMYNGPFHFVLRQGAFLLTGLVVALMVVRISISRWQELGFKLFFVSMLLLVIVLLPGVGRQVNGSVRWLGFGGLGFQVSEFAKFAVIMYMSRYMVQHQQAVRTSFIGFIKPMVLLSLMALLLLR
jgi:cell division protein FtsW